MGTYTSLRNLVLLVFFALASIGISAASTRSADDVYRSGFHKSFMSTCVADVEAHYAATKAHAYCVCLDSAIESRFSNSDLQAFYDGTADDAARQAFVRMTQVCAKKAKITPIKNR
jgi:hypothetical protein